jgi:muramoyltetrapeptide carboxypeptidase
VATSKLRLIRPKKLKQGDMVGVVAPAGPVDPAHLEEGLAVIRGMGFQPVLGRFVNAHKHFLAGEDADRADDLMVMFQNPDIKAIFCARGGYGVNRVLPLLDAKIIRQNPKVVVGSSDITLLLIYLLQKCGLVSFHGPMVAGSFGCKPMKISKTQFRKILTGVKDGGILNATKAQVLQEGTARGKLVGGCLTLMCRSLKTPYEIQTRDGIVLIEDVNEPAYRIDGMLWQLKAAGKFRGVKGIVFGEMINCRFADGQKGRLEDLFRDIVPNRSIPVLTDCPVGHGNEMWTLPLGVEATLNTDSKSLRLKTNGVA